MPERASVFEGLQFGVETTPGTAVPADKRLFSIGIDSDPDIPSEEVRSMGQKFPTDVVNGKESATLASRDILAYNDIVYILSGLLGAATITTPAHNGVFTVSLGAPSAGNFVLTYNGQTTATIAYTALGAAVQSALELLSTIGTGNVTVTGVAGGPYTVTFGTFGKRQATALTGSGAGLTGGTFAITATTAASLTRRWVFKSNQFGPDLFKTFTLEKGSSAGAVRITHALFSEFDITITQKDVAFNAKAYGQKQTEGITLTASPTDIAHVSCSSPEASCFISSDGLAYTVLDRLLEAKWSVKEKYNRLFTINAAEVSFAACIEVPTMCTSEIVCEQNSVADAMMTDLRARTKKFVKYTFEGSLIETGYKRAIEIDFAFKYRNPRRGDKDGVYAGTYDLESIYDAGLATAIKVTVDTTLTAL